MQLSEEHIRQLEKQVRRLTKKLERSEADRKQLEEASEIRERILKGVIGDFEISQAALEHRTQELEATLETLKSLQMKLVESEKMSALGILTAGLAHEINNPINFISGNLSYAEQYFRDLIQIVELYQHDYPEPSQAIQQLLQSLDIEFIKTDIKKLLGSMTLGADRISSIVQSFRSFSRLDEAEYKEVNLHDGLESTLVILNQRFQPTLDYPSGIRVIKEYGSLPLIECHPSQLNQVFMNLLTNAIDALHEAYQHRTPEERLDFPSSIWIRSARIGDRALGIEISDNGLGIPEAIGSKIFDPFFTTKPIGQGTGLGLSISHKIITELHGGELTCQPRVGQGTTFRVILPLRLASTAEVNAPMPLVFHE